MRVQLLSALWLGVSLCWINPSVGTAQEDTGPWRFHPAQSDADDLPGVLLIGDSIMNGYRGQVSAALERRASVDTWVTGLHLASPTLHQELREVLVRGPYDVIHFNIGLHGWTPGRIPEGQYEPLLREYVGILREHSPETRLIWASTTQITVKGRPTELDPVHDLTIVERNAVAARVMNDCGIAINDLYTLMADRLELAAGDRFHWKGPGKSVQAGAVIQGIQQALPALEAETSHPASVVWTTPSEGPRGSMPIGNGGVGANAWVEPSGDLVFYLSKTDAWSENGRLLKLGRIRVRTEPALFQEGATFTQTLEPTTGTIRVESRSEGRLTSLLFWIDANDAVVHVDVESTEPLELSAELEVWRTERRQLEGQEAHSAYGLHGAGGPAIFVEPDVVVPDLTDRVVVYHRNRRSLWSANLELQALGELTEAFDDPLLHRTFGLAMRGEGLASASATRLESTGPRARWALTIHPLTRRTDTVEEWLAELEARIEQTAAEVAAERYAAHREWWSDFWQRSWIEVSGEGHAAQVSRAYALQRWIHACAGRGAQPIKFNGSLFTVDASDQGAWDADYRRWGGPFWWQNTRLPYWSMLLAGDFDLMQPLFAMYLDALPLRRAATQQYYGHDGAFYPETMYFWGTYADANYGRDREGKPDGLTDNGYIRRYWQGGIELVMMMLDHHDHTGDEAFRDDVLLPLAVEITTFFDQHWPRDEQGKIHFEPSQSLETYWDATNPMPEIVGLRAVLPRLLELPIGTEQALTWTGLLAALPPVPTAEREGKTILVPAERWANKRNQENPEFYAVFPYREYTLMRGEERRQVALNTWPLRAHQGTGGWQQNAIKAALLGLETEAAKLVSANARAVAKGYRFPAFWGPNFDWIPDQDHGSVTMIALQRMLMQCEGDAIRLLPAWPEDWNVKFKLHAPHQTIVEGVFENGELARLVVTPPERREDVILP